MISDEDESPLEGKPSTLIGEDGSILDFELEQVGDGDSAEITNEFTEEEFVRSHPEGSFMAFLSDKSEENVEQLIKKSSSENEIVPSVVRLDTLLPEIRKKIWKMLSFTHIPKIRATCRTFKEDIDSDIGIQLYFDDSEEESLRLAITTIIQRLVIVNMGMSSLCKLIPHNSFKLKELNLKGCISRDAIHEILLRCHSIEILEIEHCPPEIRTVETAISSLSEETDSNSNAGTPTKRDNKDTWGSTKDWAVGNLFKNADEIRYSYGCFKKLRQIRFRASEDQERSPSNPLTYSLIHNGLLPILNSVNSQNLTVLHITVFVTLQESKFLTDSLFQVFLHARNLKDVRVKHYRTDSYNFEPLPHADVVVKKKSSSNIAFSDHRPVPQFHILDLEMPEYLTCYYDWVFLLTNQRKLRWLRWDVGGNYWLHPVQAIQTAAKTLEHITLRMIRCHRHPIFEHNFADANRKRDGEEDLELPEPLSMGHFHELISLKYFHLIGMNLHSSQFSRMNMLPKTIENLQIERFQINAEQLYAIHTTLPSLKFLSLNHWNHTWGNFVECLVMIVKMIQDQNKKYKVLTFLEKTMYSSAEQLKSMYDILSSIKTISKLNSMAVDEISGDNGIGFTLVVCESDRLKEQGKEASASAK